MSMNLVKHVPNTMQEVPRYEHNWRSNTKKAEYSEYNHAPNLQLPRSLMPEVRGKC